MNAESSSGRPGPRVQFIASRDNPRYKALKRLAQVNTEYRKQGQVWIEGDHLCRAALARGLRPALAVFSESFWAAAGDKSDFLALENIVIPAAMMAGISSLSSPAPMGFVLDLPAQAPFNAGAATVVLDRVQDAGNVGSILRSAAAFGFHQVLALRGTAALWSPKVVRAGMGAHFGLRLIEDLDVDVLDGFEIPRVVTHVHEGVLLHERTPPNPCALVLGHEGQGVSAAVLARADRRVRIAQPGGEESLNVAAAAAICLHAIAVGPR